MTTSGRDTRDWEERLGAWIGARWRWWVVAVVLLFALNNLAGVVAGSLGLLAFVHRITGRLLGARSVARQIRQVVSDPDHRGEEL